MIEIGNCGSGFSHSTSSTLFKIPKFFKWSYETELDVTFFVDNAIREGVTSRCPKKYFWQVESQDLFPGVALYIRENAALISENCELLFTHSRELSQLAHNFVYLPPHATWIENPAIRPKTKLVSFLTSNKNWLPGHRVRLELLERFGKYCDVYGRGYKEVEKVEEALCDYMFSFCIENNQNYYSEKVLNVICTGGIPVYLGDRAAICEKFNPDGFIFLDENFDISLLTEEFYQSRLSAVKENLEIATEFNTVEDELWEKYLKSQFV